MKCKSTEVCKVGPISVARGAQRRSHCLRGSSTLPSSVPIMFSGWGTGQAFQRSCRLLWSMCLIDGRKSGEVRRTDTKRPLHVETRGSDSGPTSGTDVDRSVRVAWRALRKTQSKHSESHGHCTPIPKKHAVGNPRAHGAHSAGVRCTGAVPSIPIPPHLPTAPAIAPPSAIQPRSGPPERKQNGCRPLQCRSTGTSVTALKREG